MSLTRAVATSAVVLGVLLVACTSTDASGTSSSSSSSSGGSSSGGSSSGGSSSGSTSGGTDGGGEAGGDGGGTARVPKVHRPAPVACSHDRAAGDANAQLTFAACTKDDDCKSGQAGRCLVSHGGALTNFCSYDDCYADADCGAGKVCSCRDGGNSPNVCVQGNCVTDADCGAGYCSPGVPAVSVNTGVAGYWCHTAADECIDDEDCTPKGAAMRCAWNGAHFVCSDKEFLPP